MGEDLWYKLAERFIRAGVLPFPITEQVTEIMQIIITKPQAEFLLQLQNPSYNFEELKAATGLDDTALEAMVKDVMYAGALIGGRSKRAGVMVYRIPPFFPGLIEFTLMRGGWSDKDKRLARLVDEFLNGMIAGTQNSYDAVVEAMRGTPPPDRIVPVEEAIEVGEDRVIPMDELSKILANSDPIAVTICYCRHQKDLLDEPCLKTDVRRNCLSFGRSAEFVISQGFAEPVSKEDALRILKEAEDAGLVHKAFHDKLDPQKEMDGICNCCKCCCGTFRMHYRGAAALTSHSSYIAAIDADACTGCGICSEQCSAEAITIEDDVASLDPQRCLGCGVCAHLCTTGAIRLRHTEPRRVFVPPPRLDRRPPA
jgi:ferredoxin